MQNNGQAVQKSSILITLKEKLHLDVLMDKLSDSKTYIVDALVFSGIGFIAGYLLKRFSMYVVTAVLTCVSLALLQHFNFIHIYINWSRIHTLVGINVADAVNDNVPALLWQWAKIHLVASISFVVGFLVGLRCADN